MCYSSKSLFLFSCIFTFFQHDDETKTSPSILPEPRASFLGAAAGKLAPILHDDNKKLHKAGLGGIKREGTARSFNKRWGQKCAAGRRCVMCIKYLDFSHPRRTHRNEVRVVVGMEQRAEEAELEVTSARRNIVFFFLFLFICFFLPCWSACFAALTSGRVGVNAVRQTPLFFFFNGRDRKPS